MNYNYFFGAGSLNALLGKLNNTFSSIKSWVLRMFNTELYIDDSNYTKYLVPATGHKYSSLVDSRYKIYKNIDRTSGEKVVRGKINLYSTYYSSDIPLEEKIQIVGEEQGVSAAVARQRVFANDDTESVYPVVDHGLLCVPQHIRSIVFATQKVNFDNLRIIVDNMNISGSSNDNNGIRLSIFQMPIGGVYTDTKHCRKKKLENVDAGTVILTDPGRYIGLKTKCSYNHTYAGGNKFRIYASDAERLESNTYIPYIPSWVLASGGRENLSYSEPGPGETYGVVPMNYGGSIGGSTNDDAGNYKLIPGLVGTMVMFNGSWYFSE